MFRNRKPKRQREEEALEESNKRSRDIAREAFRAAGSPQVIAHSSPERKSPMEDEFLALVRKSAPVACEVRRARREVAQPINSSGVLATRLRPGSVIGMYQDSTFVDEMKSLGLQYGFRVVLVPQPWPRDTNYVSRDHQLFFLRANVSQEHAKTVYGAYVKRAEDKAVLQTKNFKGVIKPWKAIVRILGLSGWTKPRVSVMENSHRDCETFKRVPVPPVYTEGGNLIVVENKSGAEVVLASADMVVVNETIWQLAKKPRAEAVPAFTSFFGGKREVLFCEHPGYHLDLFVAVRPGPKGGAMIASLKLALQVLRQVEEGDLHDDCRSYSKSVFLQTMESLAPALDSVLDKLSDDLKRRNISVLRVPSVYYYDAKTPICNFTNGLAGDSFFITGNSKFSVLEAPFENLLEGTKVHFIGGEGAAIILQSNGSLRCQSFMLSSR